MANTKKLATSTGGVIILALAVVSFVFVPSMIGGRDKPITVGKWGNIRIQNVPESVFSNHYRNLARYAEQQKLIPEDDFSRQFFYGNLMETALKNSIIDVAMISEVEQAGYNPSEFLVNKELIKYYLDDNGLYSDIRFQNTTESLKISQRKSVEDFLKTQRYIHDLFGFEKAGGLKMSSAEKDFIKNMAKTEKSFKYVFFDFDSFPKEEIQKYGLEHENLFLKYDFSALTYQTQTEAEKILKALQSGEKTFEDAVTENENKDITDENGKMEKNERQDIARLFPDNEDLEKIVNLKPEELSPVIKTNTGLFAVIRCDSESQKPDFSSEEMITKVFNYIKNEDRGKIEDFLMKTAEEFYTAAKAEGFQNSVKKFGKESSTSNFFSINYGGLKYFPSISVQKDSVLSPAVKDENFFKSVFALKDKEISKPVLLGSTAVVLTQEQEKTSDEYTQDNASKSYEGEALGWSPYYQMIMLLSAQGMRFYTMPLAQNTFMEFIFTNPKFEDNHKALLEQNAG